MERSNRSGWKRQLLGGLTRHFGGLATATLAGAVVSGAEFGDVEPLLQQHCVECHGAKEPEGGLVLETFEGVQRGGESGPSVVAGKPAESLLVRAVEGNWGKTGKNQFMPPGKREHLSGADIDRLRAWIAAGAPGPRTNAARRELVVPKIQPKVPPRRPVQALAFEPKSKLLAIARPDGVELVDTVSRRSVRNFPGTPGGVNAVAFSRDGRFLFGAGGPPGVAGAVRQWSVSDGALVRNLEGHHDAILAMDVTADGRLLATGSYDDSIVLWDVTSGVPLRTVAANQGAITALSFRSDGRLLLSASFDRTAKLYDVASGGRLETFGQALKELNAAAFSPGGQHALTAGNDNRIRVYRVSNDGLEGSNELEATVFAHEGGILRLAFSGDGRLVASSGDDGTVKIHEFPGVKQRVNIAEQPDWPTGLAFLADDRSLAVGRADGSLAYYSVADGKPAAPPKAELQALEPRGIQRGIATRIHLRGVNLSRAGAVLVYRDGLWAALEPERDGEEVFITLEPAATEPRRAWELAVQSPEGESARVKIWVDDVRQWSAGRNLPAEPVSVWGEIKQPGQADEYLVEGRAGETWILDVRAADLGSKANLSIALLDAAGRTLVQNDDFSGGADPFLAYRFATNASLRVRVSEQGFQSSERDHFYRLTAGTLPFVTGIFPVGVRPGAEVSATVLGFNMPDGGTAKIKAPESGEVSLPGAFGTARSRRDWKWLVGEVVAVSESEPNDGLSGTQRLDVPGAVDGRLWRADGKEDVDVFAFTSRRGERWIIETVAAMRGSTADTHVEVLWPDGRPVEKVRLQAVRNSAITFRNETSDDTGIRFENYEEMELNDLIYANGEVMKLLRAPQGPDSDSILYSVGGRRRGYFDTTPLAHPLDQPVFVVEPVAPGAKALPNGLPMFTVNCENDDDAERRLGTDARLQFEAPVDGDFLVRVRDSRGISLDTSVYRLVIRPQRPDLAVSIAGPGGEVAPAGGQGFTVTVNRIDGFDGPVSVMLDHLPEGWTASNPLVIEAGHDSAQGTLFAGPGAKSPTDPEWATVTAVATASVEGRPVAMAVNPPAKPRLGSQRAKLVLTLEPIADVAAGATAPAAIELNPGKTVRARLVVQRNGFDGAVRFEAQNLPHGVIVDNIGLNGITLLQGETEREIFLTSARWVKETERLIYLEETAVGRNTTAPVALRIRGAGRQASAK